MDRLLKLSNGRTLRGGWSAWFFVGMLALSGCHGEQVESVYGQLMATPGFVDFQRVALHDQHAIDVRFDNVGRSKVQIVSVTVETADGAFAGSFENPDGVFILPGGQSNLTVHFAPRISGLQGAKLVIKTGSRMQPKLEIPLRGEGIDARARVLTPALDFGRIEAQSSKSLPVLLQNPSVLPVVVEGHFLGRDADEFAGGTVTLQPGEEKALSVAFNPGAAFERLGAKEAVTSIIPCRGCGAETIPVAAVSLDKAVVAEPGTVDFGPWPHDSHAVETAVLHNISTEPMQVSGWKMLPGSDISFGVATPSSTVTLPPDGRTSVDLTFSAARLNNDVGTFDYDVVSKRNPTNGVPVTGFGGSPKVCILPAFFDFNQTLKDYFLPNAGPIPVGGRVSTLVTVLNCGDKNAPPMTVTAVALEGTAATNADEFNLSAVTLPSRPLASGDSITFRAFFEPVREGPASVKLHVTTDRKSIQDTYANYQGTGKTYPNCNLSLTPASIDFGTVTSGLGAVLGIKLSNNGTDLCAVKNIHVADSAGGAFYMPGGTIDGDIMLPGSYFTFQVAVKAPNTEGVLTGSVALSQSNAGAPVLSVPLKAQSVAHPCLVATPPFLDFGLDRPDCPANPLTVRISNICSTPVNVTNIALGPGTTDSEFNLSPLGFGLPTTLAPGGSFSVQANYLAQVQGMNLSPLFITADNLPAPFLVPLLGESSSSLPQVDTFTQAATNSLDVLFVVDNTTNFFEQSRLPAAIPAFVQAANSRQVDLHVAVTTIGVVPTNNSCPGGAGGGEAGRFFPVDNSQPRVLTNASANLTQQLQADVSVGLCASNDEGLEAMRLALSSPLVDSADDPVTPQPNDGNLGFLRSQASLAVVFVSNNYDNSPDTVDTYVHFLRSLKGLNQPQRSVIYGLVPTSEVCAGQNGAGSRYAQAAAKTGGVAFSDVCTADWSGLLQTVVSRSAGPQTQFPLSAKPKDPTKIVVTVNGTTVTNWHYDAGGNAIIFDTPPSAGANIRASYVKACGT